MNRICWERMDEIASKALSALYDENPDVARDLVESELYLDEDEINYFCIDYWFDNGEEDEDEDC